MSERRDPYREIDRALALIGEATFGAGQDPDDVERELTEWVRQRYRHHHGTTLATVHKLIANNARLARERGGEIE
jgi:hypothetical protein